MDAIVDTGFNGFISFPRNLVQRLGLLRRGAQPSQLADGRFSVEPAYLIEVEWVSGPLRCVGTSGDLSETLIGTALLEGRALTIDFGEAKTVEIR